MIVSEIASPHRLATDAGRRAMADGGSAVDGALAAAAVLTVAYPHNVALGGDLFAIVREPDGTATAVNASGPAPAGIDVDRLRAGGAMPLTGVDAATVPGLVAGWGTLHALAGRRQWAANLGDAEALARDGVEVTPGLAAAIAKLPADTTLAPVFAPGGAPLTAGATLRQPALAETFAALASDGARALYEGPLATRFAAGLAELGSAITAADLAAFAPETGPPLRSSFGALTVLTAAPNSSGILLSQALRALETAQLADPLGADAAKLAAIFAAGMTQRSRQLGDPRHSPQDEEDWLGAAAIAAITAAATTTSAGSAGPPATGDTVAVVAVDAEGRAVSLIQSVFHSFGAQVLEPTTGILLQNRGSAFSLEPGHPNELAPGKRPLHTLMPVIVEEDGELRGVLGTMGGQVHAQIHTQVLLRLLRGEHPAEAVSAPRFAALDDKVIAESDLDPVALAALAEAELLPPHSEDFGHAQAIWRDHAPDAPFAVGTDPRADP